MGKFLETVVSEYNFWRAQHFSGDYEEVTHAGIALTNGVEVFMAQRTMDETDDPAVQETWEFPGGGLEPGEQPYEGALREFLEETGMSMPLDAMIVNGWRSSDGVYQCFVVNVTNADMAAWHEADWTPTSECQAVGWFTRETMPENLRPEVRDDTPWDLIFGVSGNSDEGDDMTDTSPEASTEAPTPDSPADYALGAPVPVHGVLAPEDTESGDGRGFNSGAMSRRDYRLPFHYQDAQASGHDNSKVVGSVDRLMRKDGLIHWEGALMPNEAADDFAGVLSFMGQFGVSVDGDRGSIDSEKTGSTGVLWFDAVRAAGLTACSIPAFGEAYVAFGPHPDMPAEGDTLTAAMVEADTLVTFGRGPGWVTDPKATNRIHDYWTKKGQPGYAKVGWGTPGDFARAKTLIGAEIAKHSPGAMKYLNQTIAQWHHDALGYWPATHAKMDRVARGVEKPAASAGFLETSEALFGEAREQGRVTEAGEREDGAVLYDLDKQLAAAHEASAKINKKAAANGWEPVLTSSASGGRVLPPAAYFDRHPDTGATVVEDPDENGIIRTYGYAGEWGVCHIGFDGQCVEIPDDQGKGYPEFHLGRTKTSEGYLNTGLITYMVEHRDGQTILSQSAQQAHFDDITNAWAAVRVGQDERGVWFSGVVLPHVPVEHLTLIEAAGQVSGEWKYGALRTILAVSVPGFPVMRASATFNDEGEMTDLVASAFNTGECEPSAMERMQALRQADAEARWDNLKASMEGLL